MTRLWAVKGRLDPSFESRIALDFEYIRDRSSWPDLRIILLTPIRSFKEMGQ